MHQDEALRGFYHFDSQPGEEHRRLAAEAASYFAPLIPGSVQKQRMLPLNLPVKMPPAFSSVFL
jgi:hypothetical protein